jgi:hypothetical protein
MLKTIVIYCLLVFGTAQAVGFVVPEDSATRAMTGANAAPIIADSDTTVTGKFFALFAESSAVTFSATMADSTQLESKTIPAEAFRFAPFTSVTWESGGTLWIYPIQ